jgi:hypothetical protein
MFYFTQNTFSHASVTHEDAFCGTYFVFMDKNYCLVRNRVHLERLTEPTKMLLVRVHFRIIYCICMLSISHCPFFLTRVTLDIWFCWFENVWVSIVPVAVVPDELSMLGMQLVRGLL